MPFRKPHQTADPESYKWNDNRSSCEIQPKGLNIIWGNDRRYWKLTTGYAELIQVSWLEVSGKVPVDKGKTYKVQFVVEVKAEGFGWGDTNVLVMAKVGKKGTYKYKEVRLKCGRKYTIPEVKDQLEIDVPENTEDKELHFGLYEVWSGKWKGGLKIYKAEVIKQS